MAFVKLSFLGGLKMRKICIFILSIAFLALVGCDNKSQKIMDNINRISEEIIQDSFFVKVVYYKETGIIKKPISEYSVGSAVLLYADTTYYYLVTNKHVIYARDKEYDSFDISVTDYKDYTYEANLFYQDESHDLIVMRFKRDLNRSYELNVILSQRKPKGKEVLYAIGMPLGAHNAVTVGYYIETCKLENEYGEKANYYVHSAILNHGNSGGMLLDSSLALIGINTIALSDENYGGAIPNTEVYTFLVNAGLISEEDK